MSPSILFATAELAPVARVGGLAEATSGLVRALREMEVDITPVLPDYEGIVLENETTFDVPMPDWAGPARARAGKFQGIGELILVDFPGIARPHPYIDPTTGQGWPDNDVRFISFSAAIAAITRQLEPDILHLNDWHTASTIGFLHSPPPTVLTIHSLGYQGATDASWLRRWPYDSWRFAWFDGANPLVGAIRAVDKIIAVSPTYARESLQEETGMGMHQELTRRGDAYVGIRNGMDTSVWNPNTDPHLPETYNVKTVKEGKATARRELLAETGWADDGALLIAVVSRLVDQKGIDLVMALAPFLDTLPARIFILGSGSPELTALVAETAATHPGRIHAVIGYDAPLTHRLLAGADLFLMPSRFEPCGQAQMQAMAYGTPTIGTRVGGLLDTIVDVDDDAKQGTGFLTLTNDVPGLVDAVHRAARAWKAPARKRAMQKRGMTADWSWTRPAEEHLAIYESLMTP